MTRAFSRLVGRLQPRLLGIVNRFADRRHDPEDIFQESLFHAYRSYPTLRSASAEGFLSWFAGIVRHRVSTAWRDGLERSRPRHATGLPWTLQRGVEPDALDACGPACDDIASLPGVEFVRVGLLLNDRFTSSIDVVSLVLSRDSTGGLRRSLREARAGMRDPGDAFREPSRTRT